MRVYVVFANVRLRTYVHARLRALCKCTSTHSYLVVYVVLCMRVYVVCANARLRSYVHARLRRFVHARLRILILSSTWFFACASTSFLQMHVYA